jgi:hydroxypyruvate reductase
MAKNPLIPDLLSIRSAALAAVEPGQAVRRNLAWETPRRLRIGSQAWEMAEGQQVYLVAAGKAAVPMAAAAADVLGGALRSGVVVTKTGHMTGQNLPASLDVFEAGHPVPDWVGLAAACAVMTLLDNLPPDARLILLLSGGASSLLPAPAGGLTLDDLQQTTQSLLKGGAAIGEINAVRKHLDLLKGGQLALLALHRPGVQLSVLVLSDVVGDPLEVIASGPACADPTTYQDAWDALARHDLLDQIPGAAAAHLRQGMAGVAPETPKPGSDIFQRVTHTLVGSNRLAALAALEQAKNLGYNSLLLTTCLEGEAREAGRFAAALAKGISQHGDPLPAPACLIWGGETTVTVRGDGLGGRNQELALSAALALDGLQGVAIMALATDGTDGPTDAAGAIVDGETVEAARRFGADPVEALRRNNSYPLLDRVGALMRTGPTGTNVNDLLVLLVGR